MEHQKELKKIYKDALDDLDLVDNIKSNMNEDFIDLLIIKTKTLPNEVKLKYLREIENEVISIQRLRSLQEGTGFGDFVNALTAEQRKIFEGSNKLVSNTEVYNNNLLVGSYQKKFISGREGIIKNKLFGGNIPIEITEPDYINFNIFKRKAYDFLKKRPRENDTELKYVYDLVKNHWRSGNRFVIKIESTFYTCQSCQGYLAYLKELAKLHGKTVEIKVIAHPEVEGTAEIIQLLNK